MSDKPKLEERDAEEKPDRENVEHSYSWVNVILDDVLRNIKSSELKSKISK